jgi:hypothetical protein
MTQNEAHRLLYGGQTNVARLALDLGVEPDELKASFRAYVAHTPFDPNSWRYALHTNSEKP